MVIRNKQQKFNAGSSYGFQSFRSASSAATDRIRCSMGEWKQRNQFSNKALSTYDYMAQTGRATIKDSLITCREHTSSGQRTELLCQGPCGRVRSANDFSKASKRNKKLWCKDCTDWQTAELDSNLPPPGTELSFDELNGTCKGSQAQVHNDREEAQSTFSVGNSSSVHGSFLDEDEDEEYETTNASETTDSQPSIIDSDDDDEDDDDEDDLSSGYWSDGSDGTIHAGLGSLSPATGLTGLKLLTTYTHSAQSQTASSASQPDISSDGLSTVATTTKATSKAPSDEFRNDTRNDTRNTTTDRVRSNGWVRERKPKTFQVPSYIRNGGLPQEQENRRLRGEDSDDSF